MVRRLAQDVWAWRKKFFVYLGVGGLLDLVREFLRAKAMDWFYSHLGSFGQWFVTYPLATVTICVCTILAIIVILAIREWKTIQESPIVNSKGVPFKSRGLSTKQAFGFSGLLVFMIVVFSYGTYNYYQVSVPVLLDKYSLGYVIFDATSEQSVFPYNGRGELAKWNIDWSAVRATKLSNGLIKIESPNVQYGGFRFNENYFTCPDRVGRLCNSPVLLSNGGVNMSGEILRTDAKGTVFLFGFNPSSLGGGVFYPGR